MTTTDVRVARATWSRIAEPGDPVAGALLASLGPLAALQWLTGGRARADEHQFATLAANVRARLTTARDRWLPRLATLDISRELRVIEQLGGRVLIPGDAEWPAGLSDLGASAPACLWVRGPLNLADATSRSVALVGARASTAYGNHVAAHLATGCADRGFTVISGGAYGIDAAAHRSALAVGGRTIAVLACGVDRAYPSGNAALIGKIADEGAVISELAPGSSPSRSRFLQRNRLIAALAGATVVVEAAWRSGALNTVSHAEALGRPIGAVPGPVTSAASAGCHRMLRDHGAVCVTDADECAELAGQIGRDLAPVPHTVPTIWDDLSPEVAAVLEATPIRNWAPVTAIARAGARSVDETLAALARLELAGRVRRDGGRWRQVPQRAGT